MTKLQQIEIWIYRLGEFANEIEQMGYLTLSDHIDSIIDDLEAEAHFLTISPEVILRHVPR